MGKNLGEVINNIMEENASNRVLILTNHMHIIGTIHEFYDKCHDCHECLVALKDVKIAKIKDLTTCSDTECDCHSEVFAHYKWFNISTKAIVGFSIISESE